MLLDIATVFVSATLATSLETNSWPVTGAGVFYHVTLVRGRSIGIVFALLCGLAAALVLVSRRLNLYKPASLTNFLHEQRLSMQACVAAGLLLTGMLYLLHADDIPRSIVLLTLVLATGLLGLRRIVYRILLYRRFDRGIDLRNVPIVGAGAEARALQHHLQSIRRLGYTVKGLVHPAELEIPVNKRAAGFDGLEALFERARAQFVDEIIFTTHCEQDLMQELLDRAREYGVDLRLMPDFYSGMPWNNPIEYLGQFPTIPLHRGRVPEFGVVLKRGLDITVSLLVLLLLAPILVCIALAIKLDSRGPVFYRAERIGKKGRVFRCFKFRTMVQDAEARRGDVLHGDMSVVGPRPPIASEVKEYKLGHLRRLSVTPGITGLWQVQARRDPSFDSYVSLDLTYIENWSLWLDIKIMVRTVGVVLSGTGS